MTLKCNSFLKKLSIIRYRAVVTLDPRVREDDKHYVISTKVEIQRCGEVKAIKKPNHEWFGFFESGAGKEARTPDPNLGKVVLYQLSYSRKWHPQGDSNPCYRRERAVS
jgi:hypothetical protein